MVGTASTAAYCSNDPVLVKKE